MITFKLTFEWIVKKTIETAVWPWHQHMAQLCLYSRKASGKMCWSYSFVSNNWTSVYFDLSWIFLLFWGGLFMPTPCFGSKKSSFKLLYSNYYITNVNANAHLAAFLFVLSHFLCKAKELRLFRTYVESRNFISININTWLSSGYSTYPDSPKTFHNVKRCFH